MPIETTRDGPYYCSSTEQSASNTSSTYELSSSQMSTSAIDPAIDEIVQETFSLVHVGNCSVPADLEWSSSKSGSAETFDPASIMAQSSIKTTAMNTPRKKVPAFVRRGHSPRPHITLFYQQSLDGHFIPLESTQNPDSSTAAYRLCERLRAGHDAYVEANGTIGMVAQANHQVLNIGLAGISSALPVSKSASPLHLPAVSFGDSQAVVDSLERLFAAKFRRLLIDSNPMLIRHLLSTSYFDKLVIIIKPGYVGTTSSQTLASQVNETISGIAEGLELANVHFERLGEEMVVVGEPKW